MGYTKVKESLRLEPLSAPPASPQENDIYNDATYGLQIYNNGAWNALGSVGLSVGMTTTYSAGAASVIKYDTVIDQSGILYNTATGLATIQVPGYYIVAANRFTGSPSVSAIYVVKTGVAHPYLCSGPTTVLAGGSIRLRLAAEDTIAIFSESPADYVGAAGPNFINTMSIWKV